MIITVSSDFSIRHRPLVLAGVTHALRVYHAKFCSASPTRPSTLPRLVSRRQGALSKAVLLPANTHLRREMETEDTFQADVRARRRTSISKVGAADDLAAPAAAGKGIEDAFASFSPGAPGARPASRAPNGGTVSAMDDLFAGGG